jgi:N-acetylneuraminic acid mutarotase
VGTWRRLPTAPIPAGGYEYNGVWTGRELLIVGAASGKGAGMAYNPATNTWRRLPAMGDAGRTMHSATWTGRQLLVWGGRTYRDDSWTTPHNGVAYDPATNRWLAMPRSPLQGRTNHVAAWTGSQFLIWGGSTVAGGSAANGAAYVPQPL